jgi:biotin transport system substrate-specific component
MTTLTHNSTLAQAIWPRRADTKATAWGRDALLVIAFSLLTALSAQLSIHLPFTPIPITGQTFAVLLTGALLGPRLGAAAMVLYLAEGAAGLPVFAPPYQGLASFAGPAGGYLLAYPFAAGLVGGLAVRGWDRKPLTMLGAMLLGSLVIYAGGVGWLAHFLGVQKALLFGMVPFLPGDAVKALLAAGLLPMGWKLIGNRRG